MYRVCWRTGKTNEVHGLNLTKVILCIPSFSYVPSGKFLPIEQFQHRPRMMRRWVLALTQSCIWSLHCSLIDQHASCRVEAVPLLLLPIQLHCTSSRSDDVRTLELEMYHFYCYQSNYTAATEWIVYWHGWPRDWIPFCLLQPQHKDNFTTDSLIPNKTAKVSPKLMYVTKNNQMIALRSAFKFGL
jgi:hypothetical protein